MNTKPLLEGQGLTCIRDGRTLFQELDLTLGSGELLQIEGVNGAGKTSLLRLLCGLAQPRDGNIYWQGVPIRQCRTDYHEQLLYIGHQPGIKDELTALENLRFFHALSGHGDNDEDLFQALDQVGLYGYEDAPVRTLSAGQRRRVALARLWLNRASLWILDEPFTAIDRKGIANLEAILSRHAQSGGMVVLTSHQTLHLKDVPLGHLNLS